MHQAHDAHPGTSSLRAPPPPPPTSRDAQSTGSRPGPSPCHICCPSPECPPPTERSRRRRVPRWGRVPADLQTVPHSDWSRTLPTVTTRCRSQAPHRHESEPRWSRDLQDRRESLRSSGTDRRGPLVYRQLDRELGDIGLSEAVVQTQRAQSWSSARDCFSARPAFRRKRPPRPVRPLAGSLRERS